MSVAHVGSATGALTMSAVPGRCCRVGDRRGQAGRSGTATPVEPALSVQVAETLVALATVMVSQVFWNTSFTTPPRAKTMMTMSAAMAATSRPYSTADAPSSSSLRFSEALEQLKH